MNKEVVMINTRFEAVEIPTVAMPLVTSALAKIDHDYGTGYPNYAGGINGGRSFHNGYHSRSVITDFDQLASVIEVDDTERMVGIAASAVHDVEQDLGPGRNEAASADWLDRPLKDDMHLSDRYVAMGRGAVLGTIPLFENGVMVSQAANTNEYPTKRHEKVAKMVASADLGRLYTPDSQYVAHMLLKEIHGCSPHDPIDFDKVLNFQRGEVVFLEQYRFPLVEAAGVLAVGKAAVIRYAESLVDSIEQGDITTWDELIARDLTYMTQAA
jgi:hypothetical protein